jgi:hypothetical protein
LQLQQKRSALTQTSGGVDAWTSAPSAFAVAATNNADVVAAVNFARENNLRLVIKGGGHSYQGTSSSADSLLIWTRVMNGIVLLDAFVPQGCAGKQTPQPAVTVGAGALWAQAYDAVTTKAGRYVQGGGCTTVGVAGLIQSGGFGSFSKNYGMAAAGLLEAEVVTADGSVRVANACRNPELFWGLKGGGGGSLGVVTRLTLRTRELPDYFGGVFGTIKARSDTAFRELTARVIAFYHDDLFNPHWGEQIRFAPDNTITISMVFQGLNRQQAAGVWRPFLDWVASSPEHFSIGNGLTILDVPARHFWDALAIRKNAPAFILSDDRPGAPEGNFFWAGKSARSSASPLRIQICLAAGIIVEKRSATSTRRSAVRQQPPLGCIVAFQQRTCRSASSRTGRGERHCNEPLCVGRFCFGDYRHRRTTGFPRHRRPRT